MTIERINPGPRSSEMVVHNDTIYVTTTPNKPYDPALSAAGQAQQILATVRGQAAGQPRHGQIEAAGGRRSGCPTSATSRR